MRGTLKICHTAVWTVSSESSSFTSQFHCPLHPSFLLKNKVCSIRLCTGWLSWASKERFMAQNRDARLAGHPVNIPMIVCCSWKIRFFVSKNGYNRSRVIHLARGSFRWHLTVTEFFFQSVCGDCFLFSQTASAAFPGRYSGSWHCHIKQRNDTTKL